MANYPPPPQPEQQHYNPMYAATAIVPQLHDPTQQGQFQYPAANQALYAKADLQTPNHNTQVQHVAQDVSQHQANFDQQQSQSMQQTQQTSQSMQSHPVSGPNLTYPYQSPPNPYQMQQESPEKQKDRSRKACDSCSIRKVKCDAAGPPCRACAALDIPCTFDRPTRRRGPPNKHAESIKRRKMDDSPSFNRTDNGSPSSPPQVSQGLAALSSQTSGPPLTADAICPIETLDLLIDDFFTYIHPLCPFPHEPSFRDAWKRREDRTNKSFLALLASMVGALVSSFPRKPRLHLKAQKKQNLFPNHMSLVYRCQEVCAMARGPGYLENDNLNVYDAATSYFMGLMGIYTFRWRIGRLYFGECLTITRTLGLHKATEQTFTKLGGLPASVGSSGANFEGSPNQTMDNITIEMGRRIFWTMFVGVKTLQQLGTYFSELVIPPETPSDPYPPLPAEYDDFCIYPTGVETNLQPAGQLSLLVGFNANVKVFSSYNALSTMEMAWGIDAVVDWDRQKRVLNESLQRCKRAMKELPSELTVYPQAGPFAEQEDQKRPHGHRPSFAQPNLSRDPAQSLLSPSQRTPLEQSQEERRRIQYEIQKANIYASSLSTRSYLVEKYFNLVEAHERSRAQSRSLPNSPATSMIAAGFDKVLPQAPTSNADSCEQEMVDERESIVKDLLVILYSINQVNMEPNADSFTMKIRYIASTLLDSPDQRKGQMALRAQEYLAAFLKILVKLERVSPANSDPDQPEDEEAELRHWADLREYQMKFAQQGGLLGV